MDNNIKEKKSGLFRIKEASINRKIFRLISFALLISFITAGVAPLPATAAYMFASDVTDGYLKKIDQTTGAATNVGLIGDPASVRIQGLSASPYSGIVYGAETYNSELWTIDVTTAATNFVGAFGYDIKELAYDPVNGELYGTDFANLYTVNQGTGAANLIGAFHPDIGAAWALDYDTATGRIYGADGFSFSNYSLFWADPSTGVATLIGSTGRYDISDIAFDRETGVLYGIEASINPDYFFTIDKDTAVTTNIGLMGEPIRVVGLAKPIPEPITLILLGTGLVGLMGLTRKK